MNLDTFPVWNDDDQVPEGFEPLTWAWDLHTSEHPMMMREAVRLSERGVEVGLKLWDNRKSMEPVRVSDDRVTEKRSVWAELWTRQPTKEKLWKND